MGALTFLNKFPCYLSGVRLASLSTRRERDEIVNKSLTLYSPQYPIFRDFFLWLFGPFAARDVSGFLIKSLKFLAFCVDFGTEKFGKFLPHFIFLTIPRISGGSSSSDTSFRSLI